MTTTLGLSSSGEDAITRSIDVSPEISVGSLDEAYDVEWTVAALERRNHHRIALQFPDELLHISVPLYRAIKARLDPTRELYVLADTTYGSCCVDEVAAQHVDADVVVHYGHACLSPTSRLPVIYVFGQKPIDSDHCVTSLIQECSAAIKEKSTILLLHDVAYEHQADAITTKLQERLPTAQIIASGTSRICEPQSKPMLTNADKLPLAQPEADTQPSEHSGFSSRRYKLPDAIDIASCLIFYIGGESLALTNILMTHSSNEIWSYDPTTRTARLESSRTNRLLMRRYALVQKAGDADVFGILIGTLGVAQYLPMIKHIRGQLSRARKKSYTVSVGKLNPSKLGNLMEIECYVLVACPENSVIDSKDFLRPIVTPFELDIALSAGRREWTGQYLLDFERVLKDAKSGTEGRPTVEETPDSDTEDPDRPTFSLVTGKYRHAKRYGEPSEVKSLSDETAALTLRNQDTTVARFMDSAGGQFLQNRTFQGLEQRLGQDKPSALETGRSGIARGYGELDLPKPA